jgi:hypothetical protein
MTREICLRALTDLRCFIRDFLKSSVRTPDTYREISKKENDRCR